MIAVTEPFNPATRGHHVLYREHEVNHCPGCGRTHWLIGRMLAECAFCSTAMPLEASLREQSAARIVQKGVAVDPWPRPIFERPRIISRGSNA